MLVKKVGWLRWGAVTLLALGVACGEGDGDAAVNDGGGSGEGGNGGPTVDLDLTLVSVLDVDTSNPIAAPHDVLIFNSETGEPLEGFEDGVTSEAETGRVFIPGAPADIRADLHVIGNPDAASATYDTVSLNVPHGTGDTLLRVSIVDLKAAAEQTGNFTPKRDHASAAGSVYWTPGGPGSPRMGTLGCAQIFLDGSESPADGPSDQRYIGDTGLPVPIELRDKTGLGGQFYFGNLTVGEHTIAVSMDGGETFLAEQTFNIARSHDMAIGEDKTILYLLGLDVDLDENPSPATCDGVY